MIRIRMMRTLPVAPTGLFVETWAEGTEHDVSEDLLHQLIQAGAVEIVENKAHAAAPENKAKRGRPRKVQHD